MSNMTSCANFPLDPSLYCQHVLGSCQDEISGLFNYYSFAYCTVGDVPASIFILILFLIWLFVFCGTAASDYFCPNITTVSKLLRLPPDIAGVTLVAFGNCVNDVVGNIIAFRSTGSGDLAFGEMIGAGLLTSCIVCGTIAVSVKDDILLTAHGVMRDSSTYLIALIVLMVIFIQGYVWWWQGLIMLFIYLLYTLSLLIFSSKFVGRRLERFFPMFLRKQMISYQSKQRSLNSLSDDLVDGSLSEIPTITIDDAGIGMSPIQEVSIDVPPPTPADSSSTIYHIKDANGSSAIFSGSSSTDQLVLPRSRSRRTRSEPQNIIIQPPNEVPDTTKQSISRQKSAEARSDSLESRDLSPNNLTPPRMSLRRPMSGSGQRLSLAFRTYTPDAVDIGRDMMSPLSSPGLYSSDEDEKRSVKSRCENILSFHVQERIFGSLSGGSVASALELKDAISILRSSSDSLSRPRTLDGIVLDEVPALFSSVPGTLSPFGHHISAFERLDRCPTCFKCFGHLEEAISAKRRHIFLYHIFPILRTWGFMKIFGKFMAIVNLPPVFLLSISVPVVTTYEDTISDLPQASEPDEVPSINVANDTSPSNYRSPSPEIARPSQHELNEIRMKSLARKRGKVEKVVVNGAVYDLECENGLVTVIPWKHIGIHSIQLGCTPVLLCFATNFYKQTAFSTQSVDFPGWALSLVIGGIVACIFLAVNHRGTRITRLRRTNNCCPNDKCLVCYYSRKLTFKAKMGRFRHAVFWKYVDWFSLMSFFGFINGIFWIVILSSEVVSLLTSLGIMMKIPDSFLGLTVFAFGNSIGDFFTNTEIAKLGYYSMATGACWAAPLMNLLISTSIVMLFLQPVATVDGKFPVLVSKILITGLCFLMFTLLCNLFVLGWWNNFHLKRSYGIFLLFLWFAFAITICLETFIQ